MSMHEAGTQKTSSLGNVPFLTRISPKNPFGLRIPKLVSSRPQQQQLLHADRLKDRRGLRTLLGAARVVGVCWQVYGTDCLRNDRRRPAPAPNPGWPNESPNTEAQEEKGIGSWLAGILGKFKVPSVFTSREREGPSDEFAYDYQQECGYLRHAGAQDALPESSYDSGSHSGYGKGEGQEDQDFERRRLKFQRRLPVIRFEILEGDEEAAKERGVTFIDCFGPKFEPQYSIRGPIGVEEGLQEDVGLRPFTERRLPVVRFEILDGDEEAERDRGVRFWDRFDSGPVDGTGEVMPERDISDHVLSAYGYGVVAVTA